MPINLSDIGFLKIKGSDYRCIISKNETIKLTQNATLKTLKIINEKNVKKFFESI